MKISISNIAWENSSLEYFLKLIKNLGCSGVELAPSCIWEEPINSSKLERNKIKNYLKNFDLELVGFHALLFTRPDLQLFLNKNSRISTIDYLCKLINLCAELGGKQIIFGSPKNRMLHGNKYEDCIKQASEDFNKIAEYGKNNNIFFCLEPLGENETEFIKSVKEGGELVKNINHPFLKLHLDSKAIFSTSEDPIFLTKKYKDLIQHVHVGDENLNEPGTINFNHSKIGIALRNIQYSKYVSIEMKKVLYDIEGSIKRSINFVKKNYLGINND